MVVGKDKGGRREAERAAAQNGLAGRVEFRGHVPQEELAALYRGATCLLFPSRYEGFGLPVVEAMASGTPVVAARAGAVPEVADEAAILVDDRNAVAFAGGIERAIADRERLVAAGLERARLFLESGRPEAAVAEVSNLRNADMARDWIADAGRYAAAERALERIEAAAILEPNDLRDGTGQPVRQQSAVASNTGT